VDRYAVAHAGQAREAVRRIIERHALMVPVDFVAATGVRGARWCRIKPASGEWRAII
jgi:hypothetical protein